MKYRLILACITITLLFAWIHIDSQSRYKARMNKNQALGPHLMDTELRSPLGNLPLHVRTVHATTPTIDIPNNAIDIDDLVDIYVNKYFEDEVERSYMKYITHCLLFKESKHGIDKGQGDGGRAAGILQFHEPTYIAYRKIMIKEGHTNNLGSRFNYENAIDTMLWAFSDGRGEAWGPYLRRECR